MIKVYLSGGMHSGWQDRVKEAVPNAEYLDPRGHDLPTAMLYSAWDAAAVDQCDLVFAYLETTNPGGPNLAAEIGRAVAQGKLVILVDEKAEPHWEVVRCWAYVVTVSLDEGIRRLAQFAEIYNPLT